MQYFPSLHKLSNGLAVILDPMDIATTCMSVSAKTGGRDESDSELGITHFLEHVLCQGTPEHKSFKAIKDYIESKGGYINADTGNIAVRIYGRILAENFDALVGLIGDLFKNSLFDEKAIDNERKVILDELRRFMDDKDKNFSHFCLQNLFPGSGLANRILGTAENIKSFAREQMLDYMARRISAKNTTIAISGKIENPSAILARLEELFSWLPAFNVSSNSAASVNPVVAHNPKPEQKQVMMRIYFEDMFPATFENKFKKKCVARFKAALSKRLYDEVRLKNGLVYGINTGAIGNETASANSIVFSSAPENLEKIAALCAQVSSDMMTTNPPTKEEFDIGAVQVKLGYADWLESAVSRRDKLQSFYHRYEKLFDFDEDMAEFDRMTLNDVIENSREYFSKPISILTQGPEFSADLEKVWIQNFKA
jgi:predicted Zn-dependent peptidase